MAAKKKIEISGFGVLSLYVIEGAVITLVLTRAIAFATTNGFALVVAAVTAVTLALWAVGFPVFARMREYEVDAEQRRLHPNATFKGRMPPFGFAGVVWKIASATVGNLFRAQNAIYEKARIVFRPPLVLVWMALSAALIAFLPMRAPPPAEMKLAQIDPDDDADSKPAPEVDKYACPAGTETLGKAPPAGHEMWCEKGGAKHGPYRKWHDDAGERLAVEGAYVDGERDGMWRAWYSSGAKQNEGAFKKGKPDGHHLGWNEQGKKILDVEYEDGHEVRKGK